ncbi:6631_t:CDS:2 [Funneliformis mosseae]|uniref:6631_t:CDS:1 n=1 Tax=Funneliformis mosseae TaxID=27381 RepID=A0A9N9HBU6_FUNMO|nr:6631_t:CDS:2 [Funneliformis mosseae]
MFTVVHSDRKTFLILGPNGYYLEITISDDRNRIGNFNAFSLFQDDLEKEIEIKSYPSHFDNFFKNIGVIWEYAPKSIKKEYKLLSDELERKFSNLEIKSRELMVTSPKKKLSHEVDDGTSSSKHEGNIRENKNVSYMDSGDGLVQFPHIYSVSTSAI